MIGPRLDKVQVAVRGLLFRCHNTEVPNSIHTEYWMKGDERLS